MDDTWARELVERATALEPPMGPIARNALRAGLRLRRRRRAQGAAVTTVAILAAGAVPTLALHGTPPASQAATGGRPRFTVSIHQVGTSVLDIRDAVTGKITARISLPPRTGTQWYGLSAESTGSFVAADVGAGTPSRLYRIRLNATGTGASLARIASIRNTTIMGLTVDRSGSWCGYVDLYTPRRAPLAVYVRLQNIHTGKIFSWLVPANYTIGSLSIDAAGDVMAVSAYYYLGHGNTRTALVQRTYLLRPASAGTLLSKVPALSHQAGPVALAPDGRTLYEALQATGLTATSFLSHQQQTFEVAAISTATGRVTAVLHTWRTTYQRFVPLLALDPAGRYLLVMDSTATAAITLGTGRYTALAHGLPRLVTQSHPGAPGGEQGGDLNPIAW